VSTQDKGESTSHDRSMSSGVAGLFCALDFFSRKKLDICRYRSGFLWNIERLKLYRFEIIMHLYFIFWHSPTIHRPKEKIIGMHFIDSRQRYSAALLNFLLSFLHSILECMLSKNRIRTLLLKGEDRGDLFANLERCYPILRATSTEDIYVSFHH
jgi:hypothetical protein